MMSSLKIEGQDSLRRAEIKLCFAVREGQTYLAEQFVQSPLKIIRPFKLSGGRILLQLLNVGPGVMAGDSYHWQLELQRGAKVVLVNQAASKVHSMPAGTHARQQVHVKVANGAELEYYPGLTIPFAEANYQQVVEVQLAKHARFACLERWSMGRAARGERFKFTSLSNQLKVYRNEMLCYADAFAFTGEASQLGLSDGFTYLAAAFWCWPRLPKRPESDTIAKLALQDEALSLEAITPEMAYLRALSHDGLSLAKTCHAVLNDWRQALGLEALAFTRFGS